MYPQANPSGWWKEATARTSRASSGSKPQPMDAHAQRSACGKKGKRGFPRVYVLWVVVCFIHSVDQTFWLQYSNQTKDLVGVRLEQYQFLLLNLREVLEGAI